VFLLSFSESRKGDRVFNQIQRAILITSATFALAACGHGTHATSAVPDRASSGHLSASDAERNAPPGTEIESGVTVTVRDGNAHIMFPPSAVVSRSNDGKVIVTVGAHTSVFSANAVVIRAGQYHRYAGVAH
jgi:hypothetical protein